MKNKFILIFHSFTFNELHKIHKKKVLLMIRILINLSDS